MFLPAGLDFLVSTFLQSAAMRHAFVRVKENHGCAGSDGQSLLSFEAGLDEELARLRDEVLGNGYWCWPLRRVEIEKRPGSEERRRLLIPAVRDRVLQTAVAAHLEPALEREFEPCSFAYRRGRSVRMAVERVYQLRMEGYHWLLDADIDDFFDSVQADTVLGRVAVLTEDETAVRLLRLWLDYAIWDGLNLTRPGIGLPQGCVVSPMLANLCLDTLDEHVQDAGFKLVRYADDFVILTKSERAAREAQALCEETLELLRLHLDEGKTRICRFSEGFKFLGTIFLKDMLLQPWKPGRRKLKILSSAGPLPPPFFPTQERRPLRRYTAWSAR